MKITNLKLQLSNKSQITNYSKQSVFGSWYLKIVCKLKIVNCKLHEGFTLLELLVVIAVIATFLTIGLNSFATAQKKGRDTKRKSDMRDIHNALEQYYSVCGNAYPEPTDGVFYDTIACTTPPVLPIMPTIPTDPRQVTPYFCPTPVNGTCNTNGYTICSYLESETNPFCVSNSQ